MPKTAKNVSETNLSILKREKDKHTNVIRNKHPISITDRARQKISKHTEDL